MRMQAVDCPCGAHLEAAEDQLFVAVRTHADQEHPNQYADAALQQLIEVSSYEVAAAR
jgi:hypothetical protein